ncbi:MAG: hypothetical protein ABI868_09565 [Acidobacteriota bacterium]
MAARARQRRVDGTEIAALPISKRADLLKVGDVILAFNVALFLFVMSILGVDARSTRS